MWHSRVFGIISVCLVLSTNVQGSCLEYGHSCWGAHGKRSSGSAVDSKARLVERNSRDGNQLNLLDADNRLVANKFVINEAATSAETAPHLSTSAEDISADSNYSTKERNYLGQRQLKFPLHKSNNDGSNTPIDNSNRKSETADSREERQRSLHLQQQQRKYPQHIERWHKLPIFGLRRTYANTPLTLNDAAPLELPTRNAEKDLLQQIEQLAGERYDDAGVYYDFL